MDEKLAVYESKMTKTYDGLVKEFAAIRAGRANPHVLDKLRVDYYGTPTPIQQAGECDCAGGKNDPDPALGVQSDQSH